MKRIYSAPLPEASATNQLEDLSAVLTNQGLLGGGTLVEQLSSEASDLSLEGQYRYGDRFARMLADELEELSNAQFGALPLHRSSGQASNAGYHEIETASIEPAHATAEAVLRWELGLKAVGTKNTHWRAVTTEVTQPDPGHSFGNNMESLVGLPSGASKLRALDSTTGPEERETPTVVETRATEFGDIDLYDAREFSFTNPVYRYDLDYSSIGVVDPVVWDTTAGSAYGGGVYGEGYYGGISPKYLEDGDGNRIRQWMHVFDTSHDFSGVPILDNGLLRVWLTEDTTGIAVEEWDDAAEEWSVLDLPETDWVLEDTDVTVITPVRAEAHLEFKHSDGSLYSLDVNLDRGHDALQVWIPATVTDPIPSGLESHLSPVASESVYDAGVEQQLVSREEVKE